MLGTAQLGEERHAALQHDALGNGAIFSGGRGDYEGSLRSVYVEEALVPSLRSGQVVVMDNLTAHKGEGVRELIEKRGCELVFLPPYSPDFNPIENAFAKLKALLRRAAERTIGALWDRISIILDAFTPAECTNYFAAAGYDAV